MARKEEAPIVETVRAYANGVGVLDQRYKDLNKGHVVQVERNIEKAMKILRGGK